jgi:pyridoxamine 5'-phosphate oxidase
MMPEDDLDAIAGFIWAELANATTDGASEFRHAQLATIGAQGWPQSRTIILRHADNMRREVGFHTDRRSTKAAELAINTSVAVVAYDRPRGLQLRLWGQAELHTENPQAEQVWAALYPPLRAPYRAQYAPGTPLDTPIAANPSDTARNPANPDAGFENFAFVAIRVVRLEWLHIRPTRHRRARFEWAAGWQGNWLAP